MIGTYLVDGCTRDLLGEQSTVCKQALLSLSRDCTLEYSRRAMPWHTLSIDARLRAVLARIAMLVNGRVADP